MREHAVRTAIDTATLNREGTPMSANEKRTAELQLAGVASQNGTDAG